MPASLPFYIHENDPPAKRRILCAAMKLFSERGLAATSVRDIADESGYTNPALYKHFATKEELALHLFETCHQHVWTRCAVALNSAGDFDGKVEAYIGQLLELVDEYPEVAAFLSDSSRVLWPKARPEVRRQTMISLANSLVAQASKEAPKQAPKAGQAPGTTCRASPVDPRVVAASLQGTIEQIARMIRVGVVPGPASRWKADLVTLFKKAVA
jgi:TetR/AcrR family transcriptional regulator, repressor of fatR-cypB operon